MKIFLTLFVLLFSSTVLAEWIVVSKDNETSYFIDYDTFEKISGFVNFWNMENYENGLGGNREVMSSINLLRTDCKTKQIKYMYSFYYSNRNGEGKIVDTILIPDENWTTFNRYSHFDEMYIEACN